MHEVKLRELYPSADEVRRSVGEGRAPAPYDEVPTLKELGYDVSWESTNFLMGPPKMAKEAVAVLAAALEKGAKDPEYVKFAGERNTRWEYIASGAIVPAFDRRRDVE